MDRVVIGTRRSRLALAQSAIVRHRLQEAHPGLRVELREFVTTGDRLLDRPVHEIGTKGLFTRELDRALLGGEVDLVVHSLKDLPADCPEGVALVSVPDRENPLDCLLSKGRGGLQALPSGARLGTSSLRRTSQLRRHRPDLEIVAMRGNLETRWRKLERGDCEALVLALAGVRRLGWGDRVTEVIPPAVCLPAPCQGAIGVTARDGDEAMLALARSIEDPVARVECDCERSFLEELAGGCSVPAGALARLRADGMIAVSGLVASTGGERSVRESAEGPAAEAESLGRRLARVLLDAGGRAWIRAPGGEKA